MPFTPLRDSVQPSRGPDSGSGIFVRAMSWIMARFIEGFASCAVGMHPDLMWFTDEHNDQSGVPSSGMRRPSPTDIAPRETITGGSAASQPAAHAAVYRDD
jgi:hypothetical protein